jgi:signal transduction histidine kinase/putative methionine-R-sulfoxide reductase with GAF domain
MKTRRSGYTGPQAAALVLDARRLEALTSIAATIAHSRDLDTALAAGLDATLATLGLQVGGVYLRDEETGELKATIHYRGVPPEYAEAVARFAHGEALIGRVLEQEAPVVVRQLSAMPEAREATRRLGLGSFVFVPLYGQGHGLGVMPVGGFEVRDFPPEELRLLEAVGGLLGTAIQNARLLTRTRRHLEQVRALWEIDRAIVEDRDLSVVLETIAREAGILGGGDTAIALFDEGQQLRIAGSYGPRALAALGQPLALGETALTTLLGSSAPRALHLDAAGGSLRAFLLPLRDGERTQGGLVVVKPEAEARPDDLAILDTFAHQAAVAAAKARLREVEDRRAAQLALVSAAAEIAASTLDVAALLGSVARYIQRSFNYYAVALYVVESKSRDAYLAGAAGVASVMPKGHRMRFGQGVIGWVAEHGEYVLANDVRREPRYVRSKFGATQSELAVPVRLSGEVVAVINVESDRLGAFDEGDVVAIDAIAAQVASAIRNARLFEEKVRALKNLEILQEITNVLNSELDLDALLDRIARRSVEAVRPAQMGCVLLYDGQALTVRSSFGYQNAEVLAAMRMAFHEGLPGSVFVSGHGRVATFSPGDHGRHADTFRQAAGGVDPTSALCVPISLPQEKLGVLLLENATSPEAFDADDLLFALTLADQAAIAIGNALRLRKIIELDRQRQDYLSNVSHELRTPLTIIQGYLEALDDGSAGDQAPQFLRVSREQCQRLGRLIDEILEVSRLERGVAHRHLVFAPVQLAATLRKVTQAVRQEVLLKELALRDRVAPDLPTIPGDERLLHLLMQHLVENAVKFTPKGGTVDVNLDCVDGELVLSVADTGIGISDEHHERIFDKFYTVTGGLARAHGGAGIGLYLVKEVVDIHRGRIVVESQPGSGALFEVRLPVAPRA